MRNEDRKRKFPPNQSNKSNGFSIYQHPEGSLIGAVVGWVAALHKG